MIDSKPMVTVLMPVYNGARYLRQSIESILDQTYKDFELLIIDDASTDASYKIIHSYHDPRIRIIKNTENMGLIRTLNQGLSLAKGDYIARQDQDDISYPMRLEKQVGYLNSHPEVVLLGTGINTIDHQSRNIKSYGFYTASSEDAICWLLMFNNPFAHPSVMMRAKIVRDIGGYDEHYVDCEDYDLFSRLARSYKTTNLKEVLLTYRCHSNSMNANRSKKNTLLSGSIIRRNFSKYMKVDPDEKLVTLLLYIYNPGIFDPTVNVRKLLECIYSIYCKFNFIYPGARKNREIKKHIACMTLQVAFNSALKNRFASLCCYLRIFKWDFLLACGFLPRYIIKLVLVHRKVFTPKKDNK